MNESEEQKAVVISHHEISFIKEGVQDLKKQVDQLHAALIGNSLSKDGGLVQRIINVEAQQIKLEIRVEAVEKRERKEELYLKIIWGFCGAVATVLIAILINLLKN